VAKDADPHVVCALFCALISAFFPPANDKTVRLVVQQVYNINVILNDKSSWVVSRRFSQFAALHDYVRTSSFGAFVSWAVCSRVVSDTWYSCGFTVAG